MMTISGHIERSVPSGGFEKTKRSMARENIGDNALKVTTKDIGALLRANIDDKSMPKKKGTTMHHRATSRMEPMCNERWQKINKIKTVKPI